METLSAEVVCQCAFDLRNTKIDARARLRFGNPGTYSRSPYFDGQLDGVGSMIVVDNMKGTRNSALHRSTPRPEPCKQTQRFREDCIGPLCFCCISLYIYIYVSCSLSRGYVLATPDVKTHATRGSLDTSIEMRADPPADVLEVIGRSLFKNSDLHLFGVVWFLRDVLSDLWVSPKLVP